MKILLQIVFVSTLTINLCHATFTESLKNRALATKNSIQNKARQAKAVFSLKMDLLRNKLRGLKDALKNSSLNGIHKDFKAQINALLKNDESYFQYKLDPSDPAIDKSFDAELNALQAGLLKTREIMEKEHAFLQKLQSRLNNYGHLSMFSKIANKIINRSPEDLRQSLEDWADALRDTMNIIRKNYQLFVAKLAGRESGFKKYLDSDLIDPLNDYIKTHNDQMVIIAKMFTRYNETIKPEFAKLEPITP